MDNALMHLRYIDNTFAAPIGCATGLYGLAAAAAALLTAAVAASKSEMASLCQPSRHSLPDQPALYADRGPAAAASLRAASILRAATGTSYAHRFLKQYTVYAAELYTASCA